MRTVVQRVETSHVKINRKIVSEIGRGLLVLLGVEENDTQKDADYLIEKIINLRIFEDEDGRMNISVKDIDGELMVVSQFTLLADCRKGRRPSFADAARPEKASELYEYFIRQASRSGIRVRSGEFGAMMDVSLVNQGPVTLIIDS